MLKFQPGVNFSKELDIDDKLNNLSKHFYLPSKNIYLCGHSLGLQPKKSKEYINEVIEDWKNLGVEGHLHGKSPWFDYHKYLTSPMSHIVGAKNSEVVVMNSLTTNLHLLMISFFSPSKEKYKIIIDTPSFPSDKYAVQSHLKLHNLHPKKDLIEIDTFINNKCLSNDEILNKIENNITDACMILLSGVNYYTGQLYDIKSISKLAKKHNCIIGLDLAHAAGNVKLKLNEWGVDFASWCGYKYLNGGPGAPSGVFIHTKHHNKPLNRLEGWWGHNNNTRFEPPLNFDPLDGAEAWQLSNPPILSMSALRCSLDLFDEIGIDKLSVKSMMLTSYLEYLIKSLNHADISIITPNKSKDRGAQLSLVINSTNKNIEQFFKSKNITLDFRKPNVIRIAPNPFYNSFNDIYNFVNTLKSL